MKEVKRYLLLTVLLLFYVSATALLLYQYKMYRIAYQNLSQLISHPSIERVYDSEMMKEE